MIGALVDDCERPGNRGRAKAQRMGHYRGFNPASGVEASAPTVTVNGTPSHSDAPIGDQAALDAHNRIVVGRGTPADHALIETHRRQQNTPAAAPPVTSDAAKRVAEIAKGRDGSKATEAERRAAALTASIIDRYEKEHPKTATTTTATAPYRRVPRFPSNAHHRPARETARFPGRAIVPGGSSPTPAWAAKAWPAAPPTLTRLPGTQAAAIDRPCSRR